MAIDIAALDRRIGALASFSPCHSFLRDELPKRDDLRILLAHGARDRRCSVEESRSLAHALANAQKHAQYIEFDEAHIIPPEAVRALAKLVVGP